MIDIYSKEFLESNLYKQIKTKKEILIKELKLQNKNIENGNCWINPYIPKNYNDLKEHVKNILLDEEIMVYHCTKLTENDIKYLDMLKVLNMEEQSKRVIKTIKEELGVSVDLENKVIIDNSKVSNRENMIWFVYDYKYAKSKTSGCNPFFRYYGGEAIRREVFKDKKEYLECLEKIGIPVIIKSSILVKDIKEWGIENLTIKLIDFIIDRDEYLESEGCTGVNLPVKEIKYI